MCGCALFFRGWGGWLAGWRVQAQGMKGRPVLYTGAVHCFMVTVKEGGVPALYRGIVPNFMKSIPAISLTYSVFESSKRWFGQNL